MPMSDWDTAEKVWEQRLRRAAKRRGLRIEKSRLRIMSQHPGNCGLYRLRDGDKILVGSRWEASLADIEAALG